MGMSSFSPTSLLIAWTVLLYWKNGEVKSNFNLLKTFYPIIDANFIFQ
ncbi:hypothetical protein PLO_1122 [Pediococcus acidilactici NGRI 0510Q]|nr:hypothetical protein PLO_1122 [Pediococcus acidilactici NGRI 0510Q]